MSRLRGASEHARGEIDADDPGAATGKAKAEITGPAGEVHGDFAGLHDAIPRPDPPPPVLPVQESSTIEIVS